MTSPIKITFPALALFACAAASAVNAQDAAQVTLRFLSFPKSTSPQPVELLDGEGETMEVKIPTNALSQPYKVKRLSTWAVGKTETTPGPDGKAVFSSYGSAPSLASSDQLILLIRTGKENSDGMRIIPMDNTTGNFGGGQFFFMNASKVDIAGDLGGTKFALKPGKHTIIEPAKMNQREGASSNQFFTEFFFRKEEAARPFSPAHGLLTKKPAAWSSSTTTFTPNACACTPFATTWSE